MLVCPTDRVPLVFIFSALACMYARLYFSIQAGVTLSLRWVIVVSVALPVVQHAAEKAKRGAAERETQ